MHKSWRQHDVAVPIALAVLDPDDDAAAVDVFNLQRGDLAHPHTRSLAR